MLSNKELKVVTSFFIKDFEESVNKVFETWKNQPVDIDIEYKTDIYKAGLNDDAKVIYTAFVTITHKTVTGAEYSEFNVCPYLSQDMRNELKRIKDDLTVMGMRLQMNYDDTKPELTFTVWENTSTVARKYVYNGVIDFGEVLFAIRGYANSLKPEEKDLEC